ncbi:MAG: TlpA disulfide reductase family protein [Candidatus Ancaeobacter aquaticus]|nr:TlpA disulfide reductase family protein [Candidatus Ancaeobacter aquaticus]
MKKLFLIPILCVFLLSCSKTTFSGEIKTINGSDLEKKINSNQNKVLIVDFFATWCPPCQAEIPGFVELYDTYKSQSVEIIGVSVDTGGKKLVANFASKNGMNYPIYIATPDVSRKYGIRGIPDTRIYGPNGKLAKRHIGFKSKEVFESEIKELLK